MIETPWQEREEPEINPQVTLYVLGALDELGSLGIVDLAGDSPLEDREQRQDYRRLKAEGFKPPLDQVYRVLRACMCEAVTPELLRLFQGIVEEGWQTVKALRAEAKSDEANDGPDGFFQHGKIWIPL